MAAPTSARPGRHRRLLFVLAAILVLALGAAVTASVLGAGDSPTAKDGGKPSAGQSQTASPGAQSATSGASTPLLTATPVALSNEAIGEVPSKPVIQPDGAEVCTLAAGNQAGKLADPTRKALEAAGFNLGIAAGLYYSADDHACEWSGSQSLANGSLNADVMGTLFYSLGTSLHWCSLGAYAPLGVRQRLTIFTECLTPPRPNKGGKNYGPATVYPVTVKLPGGGLIVVSSVYQNAN